MANLNKVMLIGRLGADPDTRYTPQGSCVANLSICTNESYPDKQGNKVEKTEWHRIVVWGKQAEACGQFLKKGREVYVEGKLTTKKYEKDGVEKYSIEIIATSVMFLGKDNQVSGVPTEPVKKVQYDDDVPF